MFFSKGVGMHKDRLASFEAALRDAGIEKFNLVYACTDNLTLNKKIARLARQKEILCNVASHPELSSFISPAIARNENMYIAVTTSGRNPVKAVTWRNRLAHLIRKV